MLDFNNYDQVMPPVHGIEAITGLGKTREWCNTVAARLAAEGQHAVLAVPRHRLGDEIVEFLKQSGINACEYRGRDQDDPKAPGMKMCLEAERIELIGKALGRPSTRACKNRNIKCPFFEVCGYQRQRLEQPDIWVVPHQLLYRERPDFMPQPAAVGIDESYWGSALRGTEKPVTIWVPVLVADRHVPRDSHGIMDVPGTADLTEISRRLHAMLLREQPGRLRRAALIEAGLTDDDLRRALLLEWRRKKNINEVLPGMPINKVRDICGKVAEHNQEVGRLAKLWELLLRTVDGEAERSPWLELCRDGSIRMAWREDIHYSWQAPTTVMDATMPVEIVRQFFPDMKEPIRISAPALNARVRQIVDRTMSASMLIPSDSASERTNRTRQNNDERVRRFVEVRATDVHPGRVLVIAQLDLETLLLDGAIPANVEIRHFNDIAGENAWNDIALLIVIGRLEPSPRDIELTARVLCGAEIAEIPPDDKGEVRYPLVKRGVRMRDGRIVAVAGSMHPDPRAEAVRQAICEAGLMQAIGRARAVNRTARNPVQIDILTNIVLPLVTDEVTTWDAIQPSDAEVMRARGAIPLSYRDMAAAHPDLFVTDEAARKALDRENPGQMPIERYLIGVCPGFSQIEYRRKGSRGPWSTLLFNEDRVDPLAWLSQRIGEVLLNGPVRRNLSTSFREYLKRQPRSDTVEDDFVQDALRDSRLPEVQTWDELEVHLDRSSTCPAAMDAAWKVWQQYMATTTQKRRHRLVKEADRGRGMRRSVRVAGVSRLHWRKRTVEDIDIGAEAWVSLDGEMAIPARVVDKDDSHYGVEFECRSSVYGVQRGGRYFFFHDEVRTTPLLACINMVTL